MLASPAATRSRFIDWTAPFAITLVLLLAALVLLPMFRLLMTSLTGDAGSLSLEHYHQLFVDPALVKPLLTTLWTSAAVGILCILAAAPMAWLVSRTDLPAKRLLRALILASFVTPPFLGAFAWVLLGGPNAGLINQWYYTLFGLKPFDAAPLINIFQRAAWCLSWRCIHFPTCSPSWRTASMSFPASSKRPLQFSAHPRGEPLSISRYRWSCRRCWPGF